jgi:hypothetical protein
MPRRQLAGGLGQSKGVLAHSAWDALFVFLALLQGVLLVVKPSVPVIALGLWWNSNTIAHNFVHLPFFRRRSLNQLFSAYLSVLLGIPQRLWKERHLAHHAQCGEVAEREVGSDVTQRSECAWHARLQHRLTLSPQPLLSQIMPSERGDFGGEGKRIHHSAQLVLESLLVAALWSVLLALAPSFFLRTYLPGWLLGLGLCHLQGYYEHARGTTSHYGRPYNLLFFNDGYHLEHHAEPALHWRLLPARGQAVGTHSRWPPVLRWLDFFNLVSLETMVLHCPPLQKIVLQWHERAFRSLLSQFQGAHSVLIVGGGLFPRTALILLRLLPDAELTILDRDLEHLATAQRFLANTRVRFVHAIYGAGTEATADLIVIPLSFVGNGNSIYAGRSRLILVHDWLWRRQGQSAIVSVFLLKRLNLIRP